MVCMSKSEYVSVPPDTPFPLQTSIEQSFEFPFDTNVLIFIQQKKNNTQIANYFSCSKYEVLKRKLYRPTQCSPFFHEDWNQPVMVMFQRQPFLGVGFDICFQVLICKSVQFQLCFRVYNPCLLKSAMNHKHFPGKLPNTLIFQMTSKQLKYAFLFNTLTFRTTLTFQSFKKNNKFGIVAKPWLRGILTQKVLNKRRM